MRRGVLIALIALFVALAVPLRPMLWFVHGVWTDQYGAHSHGYLVLVIAVYFAWRAWRRNIQTVPVQPGWLALLPLAAFLLAALAADALFVGSAQAILLPPLIWFSLALCLGWPMAWRMLWPVLFLFFALPAWGPLNPLLQSLTVWVATRLVVLTGIPVFVEGSFVHLVSGSFEVASGCSGLNYLVAALTIAAVQCTLFLDRWKSRLWLMVAAAFAGLVANWMRVASLIYIGHVSEMQHYLIRVDHFYFGWALFMILFTPVFFYARWLGDREPAESQAVATGSAWSPTRGQLLAASALAVVISILVSAVAMRQVDAAPRTAAAMLQLEGPEVSRFSSGWQPHFVGASESRAVSTGVRPLEIYHAHYASQTHSAHVGFHENSLTGDGWQVKGVSVQEAVIAGQAMRVQELRGSLAESDHLVWSWYVLGSHAAHSKVSLAVAKVLARLAGRGDADVWAIQSACTEGCDRAREALRERLTSTTLQ